MKEETIYFHIFLKTNPHCSSLTESLKAYAVDMTPISYEYTSLTGLFQKH